jgi:N-methylhydantoinase A
VSDKFDIEEVNEIINDLKNDCQEFFKRIDAENSAQSISLHTEARYPNQVWEIEIDVPDSGITESNKKYLEERFHDRHNEIYGFESREQEIEFLYWRAEAIENNKIDYIQKISESNQTSVDDIEDEKRSLYFGGTSLQTSIYRSDSLKPGHVISGPGIIEDKNTTIVLPPETTCTITDYGNYHLET